MADRLQPLPAATATTVFALLAVICVLSLAARAVLLGEPCRVPCRAASDHVLIFDEAYYVNAARVIAGLRPPAGETYAGAPLGDDPNAEHPQLAKLIIAGSIELFGDGPLAWRFGSLVFGTLAILGVFALVRAAGGATAVALGAAALMAADNLLLVHGRIGTLDIYALAAMLLGATLYVRRRPLAGGVVIGIGACMKLVAPFTLFALALFETLRWLRSRDDLRVRVWRLGRCVVVAAASFIGLLALLDRIAPPYDPVAAKVLTGGPFAHLSHMLSYATAQTSPHGATGIASYPWEWLGDYKPITYLNINPAQPSRALQHIHPAAHFLGMISPPVLLAGLPGLLLIAVSLAHRPRRTAPSDLELLALAWFIGTFVPFVLLSLIWQRTSYLYYMVIVMPGIYIAAAQLAVRAYDRTPRIVLAWVGTVVVAVALMYPFTPLP